jgi:hypothetical protein
VELELRAPVWALAEGRAARPGTVVGVEDERVAIAAGEGLLLVDAMALDGRELPAGEALRRAGWAKGDVLESRPWMRTQAA